MVIDLSAMVTGGPSGFGWSLLAAWTLAEQHADTPAWPALDFSLPEREEHRASLARMMCFMARVGLRGEA